MVKTIWNDYNHQPTRVKTSIVLWFSYGFPMVFLWFSHDLPNNSSHFATPKSRSPPQRHPGISWPPRSNARAAGALAPAADPFLNPMQFIYNGYMVIWYHGYNIYIWININIWVYGLIIHIYIYVLMGIWCMVIHPISWESSCIYIYLYLFITITRG